MCGIRRKLGLLLCLVVAPLGCQIRESGEIIIEEKVIPFDWTIGLSNFQQGYTASFNWTPAVPATLIRYRLDKATQEWKEIDRKEVATKTEDSVHWKAQEEGAHYRFGIEVTDLKLDIDSAPRYLYLKIPHDGDVPQKDNVLLSTPGTSISAGTAYLFDKSNKTGPVSFSGGNFKLFAKYLSTGFAANPLRLTNEGAPKNDRFEFVMKAGAVFDLLPVEVGPFDSKGTPPLIDIEDRSGVSPIKLRAVGAQHPRQKVRLKTSEGFWYLVDSKVTSLSAYEGIYRSRKKLERAVDEKLMMIAKNGKTYRFGEHSDGRWTVIDDKDFYPTEFIAADYEKIDWSDVSIPEGIKNVKEIIEVVDTLNGGTLNRVQFTLSEIYENLPDQKLVDVAKEMKVRSTDFNKAMMAANLEHIFFSNISTRGPEYAFMRYEVLHSLGVGMEGNPSKILDQLFLNMKEARKHIPEN